MTVRDVSGSAAGSVSVATPDAREQAVAQMASMGSMEATIAEIGARLEELSDQARASRRDERRLRSDERRRGFRAKRKAARARLAQGVIEGASQVASGFITMSGCNNASEWSKVAEGDGKVGSTVAGLFVSRQELRAERAEFRATEAGERSQDHADSMEAMDRSADKVRRSLEEIARAQHESTMAAARA